jgi:hypothetical protein
MDSEKQRRKINPYKDTGSRDISEIVSCCLSKNGVMFALFDIGNLSFANSNTQLQVYRNRVGNLVREFVKAIEDGRSVEQECIILREEIVKLGTLCFNSEEKRSIFIELVDKTLSKITNTGLCINFKED